MRHAPCDRPNVECRFLKHATDTNAPTNGRSAQFVQLLCIMRFVAGRYNCMCIYCSTLVSEWQTEYARSGISLGIA
jgi:hypothetical protein